MAKRIIEDDQYDFSIGRTTKYIVALSAQLLSWGIWIAFSTPATIEFCSRFSPNVKVLDIYSGEIMGIVAGVTFSVLEMLLTYFWMWKRNNVYWIGIGISMTVSILATTGFTDIGHQQANIKYDTITNAEDIVRNTRDAIEQEKKQYESYNREERLYQNSQGYVPPYVSARRRQSQERLTELNSQLNSQIKNVTDLKKATGAIVTLDPIKSKNKFLNLSNIFAILLEIAIVALLIISNAVWQKIDPPQPYQNRTQSDFGADSDSANLADVGSLSVGLKSGVRPIVLTTGHQKKPIGFGRGGADGSEQEQTVQSEEKVLRVNSVEAICTIYDHFVSTNQPYTKKGIADLVGCDESWVRKILKRERGV